jgi:hypothetical protein
MLKLKKLIQNKILNKLINLFKSKISKNLIKKIKKILQTHNKRLIQA